MDFYSGVKSIFLTTIYFESFLRVIGCLSDTCTTASKELQSLCQFCLLSECTLVIVLLSSNRQFDTFQGHPEGQPQIRNGLDRFGLSIWHLRIVFFINVGKPRTLQIGPYLGLMLGGPELFMKASWVWISLWLR